MKRLINAFIYTTLLVWASACSKQLETTPTQSIDQDQALQTSNDVQVALVGSYSDFGSADFYGGRTMLMGDLYGDVNEMTWSGTFQGLTQVKNKAVITDNVYVRDLWLSGYKAINDVNNVLSAMGVVVAKDTARIGGEAKFLRGSAYFELVRLFGKAWNDGSPATNLGVPLVLTPTRGITSENSVKRNTVAEVYQQVIKDLSEAETSLPNTNGFFATKAAASAMLARVYLQKGDYTNAALAANRAITVAVANGGVLATNYIDAFAAGNTKEDLFAMQVTASSGTNSLNTFYSTNGRGDIQITPAHLALYEAGDTRKNLFLVSSGSTYSTKYDVKPGNVHIIRLAEMYLVRAEANFRLGTSVGDSPLNDVNRIRARAKIAAYIAADITLDKILKERKLELTFEGITLNDIKRLQGTVGSLAWNSAKLVFPIPIREIRANANLIQNEGYN